MACFHHSSFLCIYWTTDRHQTLSQQSERQIWKGVKPKPHLPSQVEREQTLSDNKVWENLHLTHGLYIIAPLWMSHLNLQPQGGKHPPAFTAFFTLQTEVMSRQNTQSMREEAQRLVVNQTFFGSHRDFSVLIDIMKQSELLSSRTLSC